MYPISIQRPTQIQFLYLAVLQQLCQKLHLLFSQTIVYKTDFLQIGAFCQGAKQTFCSIVIKLWIIVATKLAERCFSFDKNAETLETLRTCIRVEFSISL